MAHFEMRTLAKSWCVSWPSVNAWDGQIVCVPTPYEQVIKFCEERNISIDWILFNQFPSVIEESTQNFTKIKYISELNINSNIDHNYELLSIDKKLLDSLYKSNNSNPESIIALNVIGDSMEPTLHNKEVILFDKNNIDISKGGIFIVSTNIGLLVKRVYLKLDGSIELITSIPANT